MEKLANNFEFSPEVQDLNNSEFDSSDPRCTNAQLTMLLLIIVGVMWYILLLLVTIKFWRTIGFMNKWMLFSFISLNIAVLLRILFFTTTYISFMRDWTTLGRCMFGFVIFTGNLFFGWGVLLGMFNWCHLIMKINQYISVIKSPINLKLLIITAVI